jgi:hypothetical protein
VPREQHYCWPLQEQAHHEQHSLMQALRDHRVKELVQVLGLLLVQPRDHHAQKPRPQELLLVLHGHCYREYHCLQEHRLDILFVFSIACLILQLQQVWHAHHEQLLLYQPAQQGQHDHHALERQPLVQVQLKMSRDRYHRVHHRRQEHHRDKLFSVLSVCSAQQLLRVLHGHREQRRLCHHVRQRQHDLHQQSHGLQLL